VVYFNKAKQEDDEEEHLPIGQLVNIDQGKDFKGMLSEVYYWLKGVWMNHFVSCFMYHSPQLSPATSHQPSTVSSSGM
jgi:hypothetical protein